jgi:hypothetical protein
LTVKHGLARPLTALFSANKAHLSRRSAPYEWPTTVSRWRCCGRRPQFRDEPEYVIEQVLGTATTVVWNVT